MAWTWTGFKYDPVFRFKNKDFFQTGQSQAEARFWKMKIHEEKDKRGTKSSFHHHEEEEIDTKEEDGDVRGDDDDSAQVSTHTSSPQLDHHEEDLPDDNHINSVDAEGVEGNIADAIGENLDDSKDATEIVIDEKKASQAECVSDGNEDGKKMVIKVIEDDEGNKWAMECISP